MDVDAATDPVWKPKEEYSRQTLTESETKRRERKWKQSEAFNEHEDLM